MLNALKSRLRMVLVAYRVVGCLKKPEDNIVKVELPLKAVSCDRSNRKQGLCGLTVL